MITDALIYMFIALASPLRLLPAATLPTELTTSFQSIGRTMHDLGSILPMSTFFTVIGLFITIEVAILIYKVVKLIAKR